MKYKRHNKAFLLAEAVVGLAILGLLLGIFSQLMASSSRMNSRINGRQMCIVAALAQLDSMSYAQCPLSDGQIDTLWPGVRVVLEESPGEGEYAGLIKCTATATLIMGDIEHSSQQVRYLPARKAEGGKDHAI